MTYTKWTNFYHFHEPKKGEKRYRMEIVNDIIASSLHVARGTNSDIVQVVTDVIIETSIHRPLYVRKFYLLSTKVLHFSGR